MDLLTIETVMRSAMLAGVHAQETIEEIVSLLDDGIIYPPSALRLLRLVNGIRCEICNKNLVNHVRKGYWILDYWNCVICGDTTSTTTRRDLDEYPTKYTVARLLSNQRLASSPGGWKSIAKNRDVETSVISSALRTCTPVKYVWEPCNAKMGHVLKVWNEHIYTWKHNFVDSCGDNAGPVLTDKDLSILKHKCLENVNILARVDGSAADGLVSWHLNEGKKCTKA